VDRLEKQNEEIIGLLKDIAGKKRTSERTSEQSLGGDSENRAEDGTVPGSPQG